MDGNRGRTSDYKKRKFYKLNEIACLSAHLLRCIKGRMYSMQPLMRLVYGPKSCAISAQLILSPFLSYCKFDHRLSFENLFVTVVPSSLSSKLDKMYCMSIYMSYG